MTKSEIEKALKDGLIIRGFNNVKKALLKGGLSKVIVSKNSVNLYNDLRLVSFGTPVEQSSLTGKEQGTLCKKPYTISVLGIKAGAAVKTKEEKKKAVVKTLKAAKKTKKAIKKKTKKK